MSAEPVLAVEGLTKRFGGIVAVDGVDFEVPPAHTKGLIGPNGAGKTTLMNCISGLYDVTRGTIRFDGEDITDRDPHEMARLGLGRTFQVTNLFDDLTVFENLRLAAQIHTTNNYNFWTRFTDFEEPAATGEEVLETIGLTNERESKVANLSHGEKRQLEIGIVMATEPDLLLLDEPTAGMASDEVGTITELIANLQSDMAIVIVEHNIDVIMELTDSIIVLHRGDLIADDDPESIRADDDVRSAYLGTNSDDRRPGGDERDARV